MLSGIQPDNRLFPPASASQPAPGAEVPRLYCTCPSPKLHTACIFNHSLSPPAARSDDATLGLRRSRLPARTPAPQSCRAVDKINSVTIMVTNLSCEGRSWRRVKMRNKDKG